jgi:diguanylate cyclase (GGDEF)-like protein
MAQHLLFDAGENRSPDPGPRKWRSPGRFLTIGTICIVALTIYFFMSTVQAIQVMDSKSIEAERERAGIAVGLLQQSGAQLDSVTIGKLGRDYLLSGAHLVPPAKLAVTETSILLAGTELVLAWTPRRLGTEVAADVVTLRIIAGGLTISTLLFLLFRLSQLAVHLDDRGRAASALATRDPLTGLTNRRGLAEALEAAFATSKPLSLLYLDLDDFKQVNDRYGHATGDQLLICVAQRLKHAVHPDDLVARLGGDEFVVLRQGEASPNDLVDLASRLHARVTLPYGLGTVEAQVGLSIGIARRTKHMVANDLMERADAALYRAKDAPGHWILFADEPTAGPAVARVA